MSQERQREGQALLERDIALSFAMKDHHAIEVPDRIPRTKRSDSDQNKELSPWKLSRERFLHCYGKSHACDSFGAKLAESKPQPLPHEGS